MRTQIPVDPRLLYDDLLGGGPAGELHKLISVSDITEGRVKGVFKHENILFAITGALYAGGGMEKAFAQQLIPLDKFVGHTFTYSEKAATHSGGHGFYNGMKVRCDDQWFAFGELQVEFVAGERDSRYDKPIQMGLF